MGGILWSPSVGWIQTEGNVGRAGRLGEGHRVRSGGAREVNKHGQMLRESEVRGLG